MKWLLREEDSERAAKLAQVETLGAPELIHSEVANALWKRWRRGEGEPPSTLPLIGILLAWSIPLAGLAPRALRLARLLTHPVYDCFYLALAIERDLQLVTVDQRFITACASSPHASRLVHLRDWA